MLRQSALCLLMAAGILAGTLAAPITASAWVNDEELYIEDDGNYLYTPETSAGTRVTIAAGDKKDLSDHIRYGVLDEDDEERWQISGEILWSSSNPDIVSVDAAGVATAKRAGVAVVTATGWDSTVRKHVQTITVGVSTPNRSTAVNSITVTEGGKINLQTLLHPEMGDAGYGTVEWASGNTGVATVDSQGLVQTNSIGSCTITATHTDSDGNVKVAKVKIRATAILLSERTREGTLVLRTGQSVDLDDLLDLGSLGGTVKGYTVSTGDSGVVSVSGAVITAKAAGSCKVTVMEKDDDEYRALYRLTVYTGA